MPRKPKPLPSQERLAELLEYQEKGFGWTLYWKPAAWWRQRDGPPAGTKPPGKASISICVDGVLYPADRLVWKLVHGRDPVGRLVHVNGNRSDNRIGNLREETTTC